MTYVILAVVAFVAGLILRFRAEAHEAGQAVRFHNINVAASVLRIEHRLDGMARTLAEMEERITDDNRRWSAVITDMQAEKFKQLTDALRDVVHETPDYAITGDDGEVPIRRVRSLRVQLARMEEMSRMAAEGSR
jgi:hypothetical protein